MRICIWYRTTESPWGGGNSFLRALAGQLVSMGHQVVDVPSPRDDVVLVNSWTADSTGRRLSPGQVAAVRAIGRGPRWARLVPPSVFHLAGRRGPAILHRVDGVAELFRGRGGQADQTQFAINPLADHTAFQSKYCQEGFAQFGVRPKHSCIIHNATAPSIFFPFEEPHELGPVLRLLAVSWSPNSRKGFATIAQIAEVPGVEVRFIGQWCPTVEPRKVRRLGVKAAPEIAEQMRQSDALVHAAMNEPCSNSIVEALASGLPVIYLDSGANRELAGEYGVELTDNLARDVAVLRARYVQLRERALRDRTKFLIETAAQQYIQAFERALEFTNTA